MVYTVTLSFRGDASLSDATNLILIFDQESTPGIYNTYYPVVWKSVTFPAGGGGLTSATYTEDFAFANTQITNSGIVKVTYETFVHIKGEEQTTLSEDTSVNPPIPAFSNPVPWESARPGQFLCINATGNSQNIGVGFFENNDSIAPDVTVVYKDVSNDSGVTGPFNPTLSAYVVVGTQNQIISGQIVDNLNWHKDLDDNTIPKNWLLTFDNNGYHLVEDPNA